MNTEILKENLENIQEYLHDFSLKMKSDKGLDLFLFISEMRDRITIVQDYENEVFDKIRYEAYEKLDTITQNGIAIVNKRKSAFFEKAKRIIKRYIKDYSAELLKYKP